MVSPASCGHAHSITASFSGFPNYSTLDTDLDATQINLLASLSAWVVADADNAEAFLGMYADR